MAWCKREMEAGLVQKLEIVCFPWILIKISEVVFIVGKTRFLLALEVKFIFRLMVNLTQPAKLCFHNEIPEDKTTRNYYIEIESHLQSYKEVKKLSEMIFQNV